MQHYIAHLTNDRWGGGMLYIYGIINKGDYYGDTSVGGILTIAPINNKDYSNKRHYYEDYHGDYYQD